MTNKEVFASVIQIASVDDVTLESGLIEAGINGSSEFVKGSLKDLELAAIPILQSLMPITSVSEGGFSQSTNGELVKQRLLFLARKLGLKDLVIELSGISVIKDASDLW